jgi:hypothetical protein
MANLQYLPITLVGSIQNGSVSSNTFYNNAGSIYDGYGYTFNATLNILLTFNSDDRTTPTPNVYDANQIVPGMWFGQGNGLAYRIESIVSLNSNTQIEVILKDVGLFNLLSDSSFSGINTPIENNNGIIFNLSEDGDPIISGIEFLRPNLPDISYWINDFYARFQYRNLLSTFYSNNDTNLVYSTGYTVGQVVYLDSTGTFQLVDVTSATQVEKSFGVITTVNEPENGNMTVKPFGEIKGGLTLTGFSIGNVLYYDETATATSFVTSTKPADAYPLYIKVSNTVGSFIGGQSTGTSSGTSGDSLFISGAGFYYTTNDIQISGSLVVSDYVETSLLRGTGSLFLQPDKTDERLFQIYNTAAPGGTDIHFKGNADFNYFGDDINYLKIDDSAQTVSIVGVNGLFVSGNIYQTGSLYVDGTLTAREIHTSYVTSSVLYQSGSTKFGDTQDDTHVFTGSLITTGSLTINGDLTVNGTSILKAIDNRESLIVSGAMNIVSNNVNASVVSASLAFESVKAIEQIINITTMDLGYF